MCSPDYPMGRLEIMCRSSTNPSIQGPSMRSAWISTIAMFAQTVCCSLQSVLRRRRTTARGTQIQSVVRYQLPVQLDKLTALKLRTDFFAHPPHCTAFYPSWCGAARPRARTCVGAGQPLPQRPIDGLRRDPAEPQPGVVPRLLDHGAATEPHEAMDERRTGLPEESEARGGRPRPRVPRRPRRGLDRGRGARVAHRADQQDCRLAA